MRKILIIEDGKPTPLSETKFTEEGKLQDYLEEYPTLIPLSEIVEGASDLICIGREVGAGTGAIDLLFIDKDGLLTIVETKLRRNREVRREVIGQIIEYASYISQWTIDNVYRIANEYFSKSNKVPPQYRGNTLDKNMKDMYREEFSDEDFRAKIAQNLKDGKMRLIIAVDELIEPLRATVTFLNSNSNFDILLLQVSNFEESPRKKALIPLLFGYTQKQGPRPSKINEEVFLNRCRAEGHKKAEELYFKVKALRDKRRDNGDFINWGVSGYSYRMPWKEYPLGETLFIADVNGNVALWLYIIEKGGNAGQKYLESLRTIADFGKKVDDYKRHKEPSFSTDKMTLKDIDKFLSVIEELGTALSS